MNKINLPQDIKMFNSINKYLITYVLRGEIDEVFNYLKKIQNQGKDTLNKFMEHISKDLSKSFIILLVNGLINKKPNFNNNDVLQIISFVPAKNLDSKFQWGALKKVSLSGLLGITSAKDLIKTNSLYSTFISSFLNEKIGMKLNKISDKKVYLNLARSGYLKAEKLLEEVMELSKKSPITLQSSIRKAVRIALDLSGNQIKNISNNLEKLNNTDTNIQYGNRNQKIKTGIIL